MNEIEAWSDYSESSPLAERVASRLGRRIVEGEIAPGAILTEVDVAAEEGASRTPVREAMLRLQSWGLVRLMPKKGALVTVPTETERRDLLEVRTVLECAAVEYVIADPDRLAAMDAQLTKILASQEASLNRPLEFARADFAFHAGIAGSARNAVMRELARNLAPRLARFTHLAVSSRIGRLDEFYSEHVKLLESIRRRDLPAFTTDVRVHLSAGHLDYPVAP